VRSQAEIGCLFAWIAATRRPQMIVEFGTAFGISAMYWSAGLDQAGSGRLLTFEPNEIWHAIAAARLAEFSGRATPVLGTFEDKIADYLGQGETIDIAFVDAIHTSDFVTPQVELLITRLAAGGLIILDDISFSDDMRQCWQRWANDPRVTASVAVADRVGILEFGTS
jgi:predicted O-methyltransferase YrrM